MKTTFTLFLTICLFIGKSTQAQTEFAPIGAEWHYGSTGFNYVHYAHHKVEKDTVIDGINCRKIAGTLVTGKRDSSTMAPLYMYNNEDTVFLYNRGFSKFTPLFVFNVAVGDTITYYFPYFDYTSFHYMHPSPEYDSFFQVKVTDIDILSINGQNLRRIWTTNNNSSYHLGGSYAEIVGATFYLIPFHPGAAIPENVEFSLRCYKDSTIFYQYTDYKCDYMYTNINELINSTTPVSLQPNPNRGKFTLKMDAAPSAQITGVLTDLSGRQVALINIASGTKEQEFQLDLTSGIYLLKLQSGDGWYSQKLVIQ